MTIRVTDQIGIGDEEVEISAIRASGPGGQHVNKASTAVHLRFDIGASSLPERVRQRLLDSRDSRITAEGVLVIKAQRYRSQEKNRAEAVERLCELVRAAARTPRKRIPTRPGRAAKRKRLEEKKKRGALKKLRSGAID